LRTELERSCSTQEIIRGRRIEIFEKVVVGKMEGTRWGLYEEGEADVM
jgi:hypothetical protein